MIVIISLQTSLVSVDSLSKSIACSQLTADFDGTLPYDNEEWIDVRLVRTIESCVATQPECIVFLDELNATAQWKSFQKLQPQYLRLSCKWSTPMPVSAVRRIHMERHRPPRQAEPAARNPDLHWAAWWLEWCQADDWRSQYTASQSGQSTDRRSRTEAQKIMERIGTTAQSKNSGCDSNYENMTPPSHASWEKKKRKSGLGKLQRSCFCKLILKSEIQGKVWEWAACKVCTS